MRSGGGAGARTGEVEARREGGAGVRREGEAGVKIGGGAGVRREAGEVGVGVETTRRKGRGRGPGMVKNILIINYLLSIEILGVQNPKRKGAP